MDKTALDHIIVTGAKQHNLKNIDLKIPKNKMVVFTGVSGSGKSSLAMDTIYAEGQRRYVESLSSYARQFLGIMKKPEVDKIEGLSPAIAIDQKTTSRNPRSTVGTITEVYDYLRLLYARIGHPHCPECEREIQKQSNEEILEKVIELLKKEPEYKQKRGVRFFILSPIIKDRKGEHANLFKNLVKQGIVRARIDGEIKDLRQGFQLIKTNKHTVDAVVSRHIVSKKKIEEIKSQLYQSIETSLRLANGRTTVSIVKDKTFDFEENPKEFKDILFSENFACPVCNISIPELEPRSFSFNSPHGACSACDGLGSQREVDEEMVINPRLTVNEGGVLPWARLFDRTTWTNKVVRAVAKEMNVTLNIPLGKMSKREKDVLLFGTGDRRFKVRYVDRDGNEIVYRARFEGLIPNLIRRYKETQSEYIRREIERYMVLEDCPDCNGCRLNKEALSVVIDDKNISEFTNLSIIKSYEWIKKLSNMLTQRELSIGTTILREIEYRLGFLTDVGLGYLTLARSSSQLSGGEAQRIRLASQIGSGLSGVLYVLDEPSIGLHYKDQNKLIKTLHHLRDLGNTVLVVEHDEETMMRSDYIFDFGPGAGKRGGEVIAEGTPDDIKKDNKSLTGRYLSGELKVGSGYVDGEEINEKVLKKVNGKKIELLGSKGRNLKNIKFEIPLGKTVCVTGVSGSGKSTLVMDTLHVALRQHFGLKINKKPEEYSGIRGAENITNVIAIDQSPIGKTPKSNPATYTKTFDYIRALFSMTTEAKIRGYQPGRFSFNVKGGRCEACRGEGQIKIEMQFMPDVYVDCEVCKGKRYNREALEITYKEKNISDILDMTVEEAVPFFENIPPIRRKLQTLHDVGLGYIHLGQPAPTLSGGEAQRIKLASELSKRSTGSTMYILDEPTTGLHFADLENLITVFKRLTIRGNTVVVIEHNLDVIFNSDWVVDLGPEGGEGGGEVLFSGPLSDLMRFEESYTAQALRDHLKS